MTTTRLSTYAPIVLRLGMTAVFVWFGVSQLAHPNAWTALVPSWITDLTGTNAVTIVQLNGAVEILASLFLALGFFVRWIALGLAVHLFIITSHLGLTPVGVRDFGLSIAMLAVALFGEDRLCMGYKQTEETKIS